MKKEKEPPLVKLREREALAKAAALLSAHAHDTLAKIRPHGLRAEDVIRFFTDQSVAGRLDPKRTPRKDHAIRLATEVARGTMRPEDAARSLVTYDRMMALAGELHDWIEAEGITDEVAAAFIADEVGRMERLKSDAPELKEARKTIGRFRPKKTKSGG